MLTEGAAILLGAKLKTPLQIGRHLDRAFEPGFEASVKPIDAATVEGVLSRQIDDLEPQLSNERQRRTKALKRAAQAYIATVAMPALAAAIQAELGTEEWSIELDPEDKDSQTLLFNYPRTGSYAGVG